MKNKSVGFSVLLKSGAILMALAPFVTFGKTLTDVINNTTDILALSIIKLIFALAVVYFMWGVVQYMLYPDGESKDKGKQMMIWGLIALTVMFAVYGLINILGNTFGLFDDNAPISAPQLPQ